MLLATVLLSGLAFAFSPAQPDASPTDGLPAGAQATDVTALADRFPSGRELSAIVVIERASGRLSEADNAAVSALAGTLESRPVPSPDGQAALLPVTLPSADAVDDLRAQVRAANLPAGLTGQVTGGAAFGRDIAAAFEGADVTLLLATAGRWCWCRAGCSGRSCRGRAAPTRHRPACGRGSPGWSAAGPPRCCWARSSCWGSARWA
ncbi:MMPL family transporter [Actinoplanes sp. NPDC051470]|uniref:MMPL family transporter n=1 Tax=Actinoplanes sp. NPDC051470 TaxID=3157224 RepID=UPI00344705AB